MVLANRGVWCLILAVLMVLAGCGGSLRQQVYRLQEKAAFKVGDHWVIKPPRQIEATRIELTRKSADDDEATAQLLTIDLISGRATFKDANGKAYPHQLADKTVQRITACLADRSWQAGQSGAPRDEQNVLSYGLCVYEGDSQVKSGVTTWVVPSAKPLPESLTLLSGAFNDAHRLAHPLSGKVDLLK